eukprot:784674-Amphidinium_carterae.2
MNCEDCHRSEADVWKRSCEGMKSAKAIVTGNYDSNVPVSVATTSRARYPTSLKLALVCLTLPNDSDVTTRKALRRLESRFTRVLSGYLRQVSKFSTGEQNF